MKQLPFRWAEQAEQKEASGPELVLDAETTEAVVALMARALVAVVRAVEEDDGDER